MTVKELIEKLSKLDSDKVVYLEIENKLHYLSGAATSVGEGIADDVVIFITAENSED